MSPNYSRATLILGVTNKIGHREVPLQCPEAKDGAKLSVIRRGVGTPENVFEATEPANHHY
jgi:hypothetical protein